MNYFKLVILADEATVSERIEAKAYSLGATPDAQVLRFVDDGGELVYEARISSRHSFTVHRLTGATATGRA